jgi:hypothetical protein
MIFKFKKRGSHSVFIWVDLAAVVFMTADENQFELDFYDNLTCDADPLEVDIIRTHDDETNEEATARVIEAWDRSRRSKAVW